jgi:flagellar protein FlaG
MDFTVTNNNIANVIVSPSQLTNIANTTTQSSTSASYSMPSTQYSGREIERSLLVQNINYYNNTIASTTSSQLQYEVHEATNRIMVRLINTETNEVIREIPEERVLDNFVKMMELVGLDIDTLH